MFDRERPQMNLTTFEKRNSVKKTTNIRRD
jgi:hypothetical protein